MFIKMELMFIDNYRKPNEQKSASYFNEYVHTERSHSSQIINNSKVRILILYNST